MTRYIIPFALFFLTIVNCQLPQQELALTSGMTITQSATIRPDTFYLNSSDSLDRPIITISGSDIVVDFNGAVLIGSNDKEWPDEFYGLGIKITPGSKVTLKNATVRGYKVAVLAEGVDSLKIEDSDFSYNYRQRLKSIREREDLSDWMSYHQNDKDEWLRYGAAIYLKECNNATVRNVQVTGGQNGLMLMQCNRGLFYNNSFHFNSGIGIGLYRSSRNRVMHNRLDWNVRGYSHGFYARGQDSAGILIYEQSNENIFAYNSATHSGDGFFLWAGQLTMDTGEGGCNDNILYGNNFSYAPTNGVEVTFSRNTIAHNILNDCTHGIWGGYSYQTVIIGNEIKNNDIGIAIEHGQQNHIAANLFQQNKIGIRLWERESQPSDWGYSEAKDVTSRSYRIMRNNFQEVDIPLQISNTSGLIISENKFFDYKKLLESQPANDSVQFSGNAVARKANLGDAQPYWNDKSFQLRDQPDVLNLQRSAQEFYVEPLPDGMNALLPATHLQGRQYILVNEWGPYDFRHPVIWLREIEGNQYTFLLLGPEEGNWKITKAEGWAKIDPKTGSFPATIIAQKMPKSDELSIQLEYIGQATRDQFGKTYERGKPFPFQFYRYQKDLNWNVHWYEWNKDTHPLENYEAFAQLKTKKPQYQERTNDLAYTFWRSPGGGINADRFATFASSTFSIKKGRYKISVTSDDGVKVFLDGKPIIDNWNIHVPETDEVEVELDGQHTLEIEHFEGGGFSTLAFQLQPVREL